MSQENVLLRPLFNAFVPIRLFRFWRRRHTTRIALAEMPDERLPDIGLTLTERDREIRRPFWD